MNNKTLIWIIVAIIAVVALVYLWIAQNPFVQRESLNQEPILKEEPSSVYVLELLTQNNSGQAGLAIFTEIENTVNVRLDILGAPEGIVQPAHIHLGSCAEIDGIKYPLSDSLNGFSETIIDIPFDKIIKGLPLALNIHKSAPEIETSVACGDIIGQ